MATAGVVDAVAAAARGAALEADDLRNQSCIVEQLELPGIDGRKYVAIEIAFQLDGGFIRDPVLPKALAGPFPAVSVARDLPIR